MKNILTLILFSTMLVQTAKPANILSNANMNAQPLLFMENKGQIVGTDGKPRQDVLFMAHTKGMNVYITNSGLHYEYIQVKNREANCQFKNNKMAWPDQVKDHEPVTATLYNLEMELDGANSTSQIEATEEDSYYENYYNVASHPEGILGIKSYHKIILHEVYPNIDWVIYVKAGKLKYDFIVKPGGDVNNIRLHYNGADHVEIKPDGSLKVTTLFGTVQEDAPFSYASATLQRIKSKFIQYSDNSIGFNAAKSFPTNSLVIDPAIVWSTYYGWINADVCNSVCTDTSGNIYMGGSSYNSQNIASGGFQDTLAGVDDAILVKFNSNGNRIWATYYGGAGDDQATSVNIDVFGNLFMAGYTASASGISSGGFQDSLGGNTDAFLVRFDLNGNRIWATYYGGSGDEGYIAKVYSDLHGHVYLVGGTNSVSGIASGGYQNNLGGGGDAYFVKFDTSGNRLWASYYGGPANESYISFALDASNNIFLSGTTTSDSGIAYNGFQNTFGGQEDAFLVKFDTSGNRLWGTYYGGGSFNAYGDWGICMCVDPFGNSFIAGQTDTQHNFAYMGYDTTYGGGTLDGFLVKFDSSGNRLWANYFGGPGSEYFNSLKADVSGNIYGVGSTGSTNEIAQGGFQNTIGGSIDGFLVKFANNGNLLWSSYFGGPNIDYAFDAALDLSGSGSMYLTGYTKSTSGIAIGGFQNIQAGDYDGFLVKISDLLNTNELSNSTGFNFYPNPAKEKITVAFNSTISKNVTLTLQNLLGQQIQNHLIAGNQGAIQFTLDISTLPSGIYILKLSDDSGSICEKLVKE